VFLAPHAATAARKTATGRQTDRQTDRQNRYTHHRAKIEKKFVLTLDIIIISTERFAY